MKKRISIILSWTITAIALIALTGMFWLQDKAPEQGDHVFRTPAPVANVNPLPDDRDYVEPSVSIPLEQDQFIRLSEYPLRRITIQRLTENSYWILHNLHGMTMYVGESEVLLVDASADLFTERLLDRIAEITPNPVTTLVYTHPHLDHVGGATALQEELQARGQSLRVIASDRMVSAIEAYQQPIPMPTEVISGRVGFFEFDNQQFKLATPVDVAHSTADSYVLFPDKVVTFIDFIQPGRLPLHDVSGVQNISGYIEFLRHVAGEDWIFAQSGHVNISSLIDVTLTLEYFEDIYNVWFDVIVENWGVDEFVRAKARGDYVGVWLRNVFDRVAHEVLVELEPKWGHYPHFEVALDHALKVQWDGFLHFDFIGHPEIRPNFTPIPPVN
jgi:glyoxylase-like metal-dependent hydrolase (beta-lactamase superfamily II)